MLFSNISINENNSQTKITVSGENKTFSFLFLENKIIDNQNLSIHETNIEIIKTLEEWGWLKEQLNNKQKSHCFQFCCLCLIINYDLKIRRFF